MKIGIKKGISAVLSWMVDCCGRYPWDAVKIYGFIEDPMDPGSGFSNHSPGLGQPRGSAKIRCRGQ